MSSCSESRYRTERRQCMAHGVDCPSIMCPCPRAQTDPKTPLAPGFGSMRLAIQAGLQSFYVCDYGTRNPHLVTCKTPCCTHAAMCVCAVDATDNWAWQIKRRTRLARPILPDMMEVASFSQRELEAARTDKTERNYCCAAIAKKLLDQRFSNLIWWPFRNLHPS